MDFSQTPLQQSQADFSQCLAERQQRTSPQAAPDTSALLEARPSPLSPRTTSQNGTAALSQTRSSLTTARMSASAPLLPRQNLKWSTHRQEPPPTSST